MEKAVRRVPVYTVIGAHLVALINSPSGASHSSATTVCTVATMEKGAGAKVKKHFFDFLGL